ncbi:T9SS type A sorting domain-containing protein [Kaistella sp.]|uniref:T9SS type A sorting domain-containing protein n=1 Tax=Kaistella sp. TaxID=2782235 RepID=UPI003C34A3E3
MMKLLRFTKVLFLVLFSVFSTKAFGQTVFSENMGVPIGDTSIATYNIGTAPATFQNIGKLSYAGNTVVSKDIPSLTYSNPSGGGNVLFTANVGQYFTIYNIDSQGYSALKLTFGLTKNTAAAVILSPVDFAVEFATDYNAGTNTGTFSPLTFTNITSGNANTWRLVSPTGVIPTSANLAIRFTQKTTTHIIRIDDVQLTGTPPAVSAGGANPIGDTTATLSGNVSNLGAGPAIIEKGFVYAKQAENGSPAVGGANVTKIVVGTAILGAFTQPVTGLTPQTAFVYRAYVYNGISYYYSPERLFTTLGQATQLVFRSPMPTPVSVGTTLTAFIVDAKRADGTIDTEYTGAVTLTTSSGTLAGTLSMNAIAGEASFKSVNFTTAGNYVITASAPGLTSGNSTPIEVHTKPLNDLCTAATALSISSPAINGYLTGAVIEQPFGNFGDVWYQFVVQQSGNYTITVAGFSSKVFFDLLKGACLKAGDTIAYIGQAKDGTNPAVLTMNLAAGTYYVRVYGGDNLGSISNFTIQVNSQTVWNGNSWDNGVPNNDITAIIDGNYTTVGNGDVVAKTLTINTGNILTVAAGTSFTTSDFANNGTLVVESDGNFVQTTGSNNTGSGSSTIKRNASMKRLDYTYWGSPVSGQNLLAFSPQTVLTRFLTYNTTKDSFDVVNDPESATFAAGKGYVIRAPNNFLATTQSFGASFTGVPNNGDIPFVLQTTGRGFNLIGNPYPSNIDFNALVNTGAIEGTAYFWTNVNAYDAENYTGDNYATYSTVSGGVSAFSSDVIPLPNIKVGQGFIVKAITGKSNLTFTNAMRNAGESVFFNKGAGMQQIDRFWLKLTTPAKNFNTILIAYPEGATNGYDANADAQQFGVSSDSFYSVLDDFKLKIQGRQFPLVQTDNVPLGMKGFEAGDYTLSIVKKEGIFDNGQNVYLKDKYSGTLTNLSEGNYAFTAKAGITEGRFEIIYQSELVLGANNANKNQMVVYREGDDFVIKSTTKKIEEVEVYDASGRLMIKLNPNQTEMKIDGSTMLNGVYILKLSSNGFVSIKKIIK